MTEKNRVLIASFSIGDTRKNEGDPVDKSVHLLTTAGFDLTQEEIEHKIGLLVNLCRTWGMEIYKVEEPGGTVVYDAFAEQEASRATH